MAGARYAVLIGSSIFPDEPKLLPLSAPEKDVDGLAAVLRSPERGCFSDVSVLKNRPQFEIIRNIQRTLNRAGRDDLVVLYYSGHGKLNRAGQLHLAAFDTVLDELESSAVPVRSIRDFVDASQSQRVVIILDCCFSGAIGGAFTKGSVDDQLQVAAREGRGTYIMTASTGIQTALEKETDQHSVFTKHLIAGIESGDADMNRDGTITADELYDYLYMRVREESHQEPTKWSVDTRGHFIIANSGRLPRKERAEELREFLFELAKENRITTKILTEALTLISRPTDSLSVSDKARDVLLDTLRDKKIDAVDFVLQWVQIRKVRLNKSPRKQAKPASEVVAETSKAPPKLASIQAEAISENPDTETRPSPDIPPLVMPLLNESPQVSVGKTVPFPQKPIRKLNENGIETPLASEVLRNPVVLFLIGIVVIGGIILAVTLNGPSPSTETGHEYSGSTQPMKLPDAARFTQTENDPISAMIKEAEQGNAGAQFRLGWMYQYGSGGVLENSEKAREWYRKAAEQGHPKARRQLDAIKIVPTHPQVPAKQADSKVVSETQAKSSTKLASEPTKKQDKKSEHGKGRSGDAMKATLMYQESTELGNDNTNYPAIHKYQKAAEEGNADAQNSLGSSYADGEGVPKDPAKAIGWYLKAAEQNNRYAQANLGWSYAHGEGVPKDAVKAVEWYRKAADQGNANAQNSLGRMYENGEGVPKDAVKAVEWYQKAADQGNDNAQNSLGRMYENGEGVPKDAVKAVEWYRKAATQSHTNAQYNLGRMYANGEGVPKDAVKAVELYRKAASKGHANAQRQLDAMK
ncbi:caspase, EACC1-associated type [Nitrosospira sp. Is2]|uniref:caspase, EACC1-associated type n=1 Tax=Nitrosospira sp. Is2 TaxID=3080532 RepID=UPI0029542D32|nr:caspase family protein [Nitrosospira sp. Is2]WON72889.1 caspase family protein [Nitrosospira sp. Is2]